jgi:hypothetical protein
LSPAEKAHWFRLWDALRFPEIEQPNKYLRVIDKFAVFCTAKSETILANDEIRGSNQRLESIIRAGNNSAADIWIATLDDSCENYEEAHSLHRLSSPAGVRTVLRKAEVLLTKVTYPFILAADAFGKKSGTLDSRVF